MAKFKAAVTVLAVMFVVGIATGWTAFNVLADIVQETMTTNNNEE